MKYQIQVDIASDWECGEWIEVTENGITGERIEAFHDTRESAQAELDDMFEEMERQGMEFSRADWRIKEMQPLGQAEANHWTEEPAQIEALAKLADAIELAPCRTDGADTEQCSAEQAQFFSVYLHFSPDNDSDPNTMRGSLCIADRPNIEDAREWATKLAENTDLPINDFTGIPS